MQDLGTKIIKAWSIWRSEIVPGGVCKELLSIKKWEVIKSGDEILVEDIIFRFRAIYDKDDISAVLLSLIDGSTQRLVKIRMLKIC